MRRRIEPFVENIGEATAACLIAMVQGNVLALSLAHWAIATRTGFFAGALASAAILVIRTRSRWVVAGTLGLLTSVVDFLVHPGNFGPVAVEAVVTGLGAGALSLLVGAIVTRVRRVRGRPARGSEA